MWRVKCLVRAFELCCLWRQEYLFKEFFKSGFGKFLEKVSVTLPNLYKSKTGERCLERRIWWQWNQSRYLVIIVSNFLLPQMRHCSLKLCFWPLCFSLIAKLPFPNEMLEEALFSSFRYFLTQQPSTDFNFAFCWELSVAWSLPCNGQFCSKWTLLYALWSEYSLWHYEFLSLRPSAAIP